MLPGSVVHMHIEKSVRKECCAYAFSVICFQKAYESIEKSVLHRKECCAYAFSVAHMLSFLLMSAPISVRLYTLLAEGPIALICVRLYTLVA